MRFQRFSDYYVCSKCGASLDPGEKCDCSRKEDEKCENNRIIIARDQVGTHTGIHHGHPQQIVV